MKYNNIKEARFLSRPNKFIAHIEIDGKPEICHVKNTGRCRELLIRDARVFVQEVVAANRKIKPESGIRIRIPIKLIPQ